MIEKKVETKQKMAVGVVYLEKAFVDLEKEFQES